ncbi:melanophilin-like [Hemiscyllium ocellatum]|uniref:melanophilin-like n=1 Tax=Hemiscyllium ocellatum TaxID=170820 RepID=UPI0029670E4C|nr:melanophilin-like [Hemiscyllium ocellatum]
MARNLDLSKLTEDEAQHVLHVVQRDLNLRKTEEDRLGELRSKVEEETTKRKFLTKQAKFNEGHCIHCLEPFQFLVNSKRRCLDCSLYTCKSCSKFNKKEFGWVCDSCRIARIVNTGSLDWFYNCVRSRFKSFGSAKVMHSLHRRMNEDGHKNNRYKLSLPLSTRGGGLAVKDGEGSPRTAMIMEAQLHVGLLGDHWRGNGPNHIRKNLSIQLLKVYDVYLFEKLAYTNTHYERDGFDHVLESYLHGEYNAQMMAEVIEEDENALDNEEAHRYSVSRRNKRLLSVHPTDFDMDSEYSAQSRRQSFQLPSPYYDGNGLQSFSEFPFTGNSTAEESSRRGSCIGDTELTSVFRNILQEKGQRLMPDSEFSTEVRLEINKRRKSLDKSSKSDEVVYREYRLPRTRSVPGIWTSLGEAEAQHSVPYQKHGAQYYADMDSSDNDGATELPVYQRHFVRRRSRSSSQERLGSGGSQISDLSRRMSSIERMLSRLEEKMTPSSVEVINHSYADIEEEKLKKKLGELASNISDKGASSDEEEVKRKTERPQEMTSSGEDLQSEALKRSSAVALCDITAKALRIINATEKALHDFAESSEKDQSVSEADEAYRKLEENVYLTASTNYSLERQLKDLEERARSRQSYTTTTTDSELSELEDKVASAVAKVQCTESEVSDIENRIAALSSTGMNVSTEDKPKRKQDGQDMVVQQPPHQKSSVPTGKKESKNADIDSSWYTGRGIRPVGRFGRRGLTLENIRKYEFGTRRVCIPIEESEESNQNE